MIVVGHTPSEVPVSLAMRIAELLPGSRLEAFAADPDWHIVAVVIDGNTVASIKWPSDRVRSEGWLSVTAEQVVQAVDPSIRDAFKKQVGAQQTFKAHHIEMNPATFGGRRSKARRGTK